MFGFTPKLPINEEHQRWTDEGFAQLSGLLGRDRMLKAEVILPYDRYFPDPYDGSKARVTAMANRIAGYLHIPTEAFMLEIYAEGENAWREGVPYRNERLRDAAGLYFHEPQDGRLLVGVHADQLEHPALLAATLAHELAHVLLLGGGFLDPAADNMEPMTDLATVFLGLGVITANAAFQFTQWTEASTQGWRVRRAGYLSEPLWGYALARFAWERGETGPKWAGELEGNTGVFFRQSAKWLKATRNRASSS